MAYERELDAALAAVREACTLCRAVRSELVLPDTLAKKDKSPVTVADFGSQAVVSLRLAEHFPDDPIVAEEEAGELRTDAATELRSRVREYVQRIRPEVSEPAILDVIDRGSHPGGAHGRFWTIDPIDGTKGFLRNEQYAVALALIENGQVVLGVLGCPNLPSNAGTGVLFAAVRGGGARAITPDGSTQQPIRVADVRDPREAVICESVESAHSSHDDAARIAALLDVHRPPVRMDSQCKYGAVARGEASIYLRLPTRGDYEEKIWDHAAGMLVVEEAGGKVTDTRGEPFDFSQGRTLRRNVGVVATNGHIHDAVIAAVRRVLS